MSHDHALAFLVGFVVAYAVVGFAAQEFLFWLDRRKRGRR